MFNITVAALCGPSIIRCTGAHLADSQSLLRALGFCTEPAGLAHSYGVTGNWRQLHACTKDKFCACSRESPSRHCMWTEKTGQRKFQVLCCRPGHVKCGPLHRHQQPATASQRPPATGRSPVLLRYKPEVHVTCWSCTSPFLTAKWRGLRRSRNGSQPGCFPALERLTSD